jgi:hypothetical protein
MELVTVWEHLLFEQHQQVYRLSTRLTLARLLVEVIKTLAKGIPYI